MKLEDAWNTWLERWNYSKRFEIGYEYRRYDVPTFVGYIVQLRWRSKKIGEPTAVAAARLNNAWKIFCWTVLPVFFLHGENLLIWIKVIHIPKRWGLADNKAFRYVENLFVQDNQVRTDQNKTSFLLTK